MRLALIIRDFFHQYQPKLQLAFSSAKVGLDREIKLSRLAGDTYEAVNYFGESVITIIDYSYLAYKAEASR